MTIVFHLGSNSQVDLFHSSRFACILADNMVFNLQLYVMDCVYFSILLGVTMDTRELKAMVPDARGVTC